MGLRRAKLHDPCTPLATLVSKYLQLILSHFLFDAIMFVMWKKKKTLDKTL